MRRDDSLKRLFTMSWPFFIELMLQLLVGNMDQVQLSHFNSTAVAAVGNANQILCLVLLVFQVITLASMILISQYRGAGDLRSVNQIYTLSACVNLGVSAALAACLFFGAPFLFRLMRVPEAISSVFPYWSALPASG